MTGSALSAPDGREWVLHVDLDQFIAAVEILRRPELRGRPVVVGGNGDPHEPRKVVATASYEARAFGVHSGMPLRAAYRRCPDAVFLADDAPAYEVASADVMDVLRGFGMPVEVWGWDEAYVGARLADPEALAHEIRARVLDTTRLSCSVGIGENKHQAKLATGFAKPAGVGRLTYDSWVETMHHRPVDALWGIGSKIMKRLGDLGITTVRELAQVDNAVLVTAFGPTNGPWLRMLARGGGDPQVVAEPWIARSRSHETTFALDLVDRDAIDEQVARLADAVTREVVADGRIVTRVAVKVRFASFYTPTKIMKLREPTTEPDVVVRAALTILGRFELGRPVRLLGVRVELAPLAEEPAATRV